MNNLEIASKNNDIYTVKSILNYYKIPIDMLDNSLLFAARNGCIEIVKLLIENGANINNYYNGGALTYAAGFGHVDIVKLLIKFGAIITPNAIEFAIDREYFEIEHILRNSSGYK